MIALSCDFYCGWLSFVCNFTRSERIPHVWRPIAVLTFLQPWEPQWWLIALFALTFTAYVCGLYQRRRIADIPGAVAFLVGLVGMYFVMQTRYDYYAQHMFYIHRLQHLVLHHMGPFLIALAAPAAVLAAGTPARLRRVGVKMMDFAPVRILYRTVQQPIIAGLLFVGLIFFWLTPSIHFDAMLSARDYWIMNLSMAAEGLLFWWFMLDPRPAGTTPTTHGIGIRMYVLWAVIPPQIVIGAYITLSGHEIFDVYDVCGRAWPVSPIVDQQIGGLITWIPAAMMSAIGTLILLHFYFRNERVREAAQLKMVPHEA